jgi:8-oxo-dGTP pyrophosphatase MutT (NUDIX family)
VSLSSPTRQVAALPFRKRRGKIEILLITSRETKRWVIPKGWPMPGLMDFSAAKREAFEEAGVEGRAGKIPIGDYSYGKKLKAGNVQTCSVAVFALSVSCVLPRWKERLERERKWFGKEAAATMVLELDLRKIIADFKG